MPTTSRLIGTTALEVASATVFQPLIDIIIQNLSANDVYVGSGADVDSNNGIKISPNGTWNNDKRAEPVWLIASGAGSDCRIQYSLYHAGER